MEENDSAMQAVAQVLTHLEARLREHELDRPHESDQSAYHNWLFDRRRLAVGLDDAVAALPIMTARPQRMLDTGNGLRGFFFTELAGHLMDVTARSGAAVACATATELLCVQELRLEARHLVWGPKVESSFELVSGVMVRPWDADDQLQRMHMWEALPWDLQVGQQLCVLASSFVVQPAYVTVVSDAFEMGDRPGARVAHRLERLALALVALGPSPVVLEYADTRHEDPELDALMPFMSRSLGQRRPRPTLPFKSVTVDTDASAYCTAFEALSGEQGARVEAALALLHQGVCSSNSLEGALHVSRALERLFRQPAPRKTANRNHVKAQANLLIPGNGKQHGRLLDDLYELRNRAAHGDILEVADDRAKAQAGAELCARLIRTMVLQNPGGLRRN